MADSLNQTGAQTLTVSTSAVALTFPTAAGKTQPRRVLIYITGQPIRWRADGALPTSTSGQPMVAGERLDWTRTDTDYNALLQQIRFIRDAGAAADATLEIAYFA